MAAPTSDYFWRWCSEQSEHGCSTSTNASTPCGRWFTCARKFPAGAAIHAARTGVIRTTLRVARRETGRTCEATRIVQLYRASGNQLIRGPMQTLFTRGWLAMGTMLLCLAGCSKPQPNAPSQDFARRHQCPVKRVESAKEGSDRMRVTGCGESELYVRSCENRAGAFPVNDTRQPVSESEARLSPPAPPPYGVPGCAWAREQRTPAPPAGSASQPKWLWVP